MTKPAINDVKALKIAGELKNSHDWKKHTRFNDEGYYTLQTEDTGDVPVRLFLTAQLLEDAEDILYRQIINATRFPGTRMVVITPDTHYGYGVPVGCVLITDADAGAVAMGPVGFDIGCFTAETLVPLADGCTLTIGELAGQGEEILVYALSSDHKIVVARAKAKQTRTNAALVRVTLDNEREIVCTPDHEFMLRDGSYVQAQYLTAQTSLMPFYAHTDKDGYRFVQHPANGKIELIDPMLSLRATINVLNFKGAFIKREAHYQLGYNHKVVSVEPLPERADVYCLTVPEYGNFALDAGVFVHNCGMMSAQSNVSVDKATPEKRLRFNEAVMRRVEMGAGGKSLRIGKVTEPEFQNLVRGGAEYYAEKYGATFDRSRAERHRIPVEDSWQIPWGGKGHPERGLNQLGSLGGGNHFIELQRSEQSGTLFLQVHTGSRGFGHGLATNFFELARAERPTEIKDIDLGYFMPESEHYGDYLNAVAAGGNFAIINRLVIYEAVAEAFREVFKDDLELIYEISHNLVQREQHPEFGDVWVHRKGATRAFPAGHPALKDTIWEQEGHPVLIPGSNKDWSYILRPLAKAVNSGYSVNHGAGRRMSRSQAIKTLSQRRVDDEYRDAGILVNTDGRVPLDEAAPCYKSSEQVVEAVINAGLAEVVHRLYPLASLKGTDDRAARRGRKKKGRGSEGKGNDNSRAHY